MFKTSPKITPKILKLIADLDEFKGRWQALRNLSRERLLQLKKVATIESVGSSTRIEGAKLSDKEVEALLSRVRRKSFATRDEQEVAGYAAAMDLVFDSWEDISLTENHIKQLHGVLLQYAIKDVRHRGEYKKFPNHVEAFDQHGKSLGIVFETTSPFDTPQSMAELVLATREALADADLHPLLIIGMFIVKFLAIHPFQDGNGRLSRVLTTLLLLRAGYAYVPYVSLESVVEENKAQYYLALRRTQATLKGKKINWQPWLEFFLRALQKQKNNLLAKVSHEKVLQESLPALAVAILELTKTSGRITIAEIEKLTGKPRGTIKARLRELLQQHHLVLHGRGKATWYSLM